MAPLITDDLIQRPRPDLTVFYVLDRSACMTCFGDRMLETAMENTVAGLKAMPLSNCRLRIAVLEFGDSAQWVTSLPEYIEDFVWPGLLQIGGVADISGALRELDTKMSRRAFLDLTGGYLPIVVFALGSRYSDSPSAEVREAIRELKNNRWFSHASKTGFIFGEARDDATMPDVLDRGESFYVCDRKASVDAFTESSLALVHQVEYPRGVALDPSVDDWDKLDTGLSEIAGLSEDPWRNLLDEDWGDGW